MIQIITLDGSRMPDVESTHKYIAEMLHFPETYGGNLEALAGCLADLGPNIHVLMMNTTWARHMLGGYADELIAVFESVANKPNQFLFAAAPR